MTFEEALQLLGIAVSDDAAALRPAYLRLLKVHRPERDPEGFKRLRQALELVQGQVWRLGHKASVRVTPQPASSPTAPFVESPALPVVIDPLEALRRRVAACDDEVQQLRLAEDGALQQRSAAAYALWVDVAEESGTEGDLERALRAACDAGFSECFGRRRRQEFTASLSALELDAWQGEALQEFDPAWTELGEALLAHGKKQEAVALGLESLARRPMDEEGLNEWTALHFALSLFAKAEPDAAMRFARALLAARDAYSRVEPVRYAALRELAQHQEALGELLTRAIASALLSNDPVLADHAFDLLKASEPKRARKLTDLLKRESPTLYNLYKTELPGPMFGWGRPSTWVLAKPVGVSGWLRGLWKVLRTSWVFWGVLTIARMLTSPMCRTSPDQAPIEVKMRKTFQDSLFLDCTPAAEPFCKDVMLFWREPDCSPAQRAALTRLQRQALTLGARLSDRTKTWLRNAPARVHLQCQTGRVP